MRGYINGTEFPSVVGCCGDNTTDASVRVTPDSPGYVCIHVCKHDLYFRQILTQVGKRLFSPQA